MAVQTDIHWEVTDTIAGDPNYCWVKRGTIPGTPGVDIGSDLAVIKRVKQAIPLAWFAHHHRERRRHHHFASTKPQCPHGLLHQLSRVRECKPMIFKFHNIRLLGIHSVQIDPTTPTESNTESTAVICNDYGVLVAVNSQAFWALNHEASETHNEMIEYLHAQMWFIENLPLGV